MATHREALPQEQLGNPGGTAKYSTFPLGRKHATTEIFGLITPIEFINAITGDEHQCGNTDAVDTYTLAAPLKSTVWKNKEWYYVPRMAILPNFWDLIYTQPTIGEDVNAAVCGTSVDSGTWTNFLNGITTELRTEIGSLNNYTPAENDAYGTFISFLENLIKLMIVNEYVFSYGSLLTRARCPMAALWKSRDGSYKNFDQCFDAFMGSLKYGIKVTWDNEEFYSVRLGSTVKKMTNELSLREFLTKARDNLNFTITAIANTSVTVDNAWPTRTSNMSAAGATSIAAIKGDIITALYDKVMTAAANYSEPVDIARLWAYQMICVENYTDDQIDYIYNCDIYRRYILDLVRISLTANSRSMDDYGSTLNGIWMQYDAMSAAGFKEVIAQYVNGQGWNYDYLTALFNLNRSLKFKDYFSGAKTIPIAPGDNTVAVVSNKFDVIDVANKSQAAKFRYAIKRIGRKIDEYVKGLFGINQAIDYHYPIWIGSTKEVLRTSETENTGAAQVSTAITDANPITSRIQGYSGDYRFVGTLDRDAIIVGVTYYDVERLYYKGVHRSFMHVDRFDYFNQYMQFTGDQPVYSEEYDAALTDSAATYFGYKPAYEEFKEEISTADGGFVTALPGYAFLNDMEKNGGNAPGYRANEHVSPDFIRSKPTEMDRFYKVLSGYSLANYFHFIVVYNHSDEAKRPIVYNPNLAL